MPAKIAAMRQIVTVLAIAMLFASPALVFAKEIEDRKWLEVRTPNFEIRSLLSKKETIKLARNLEVFRVVAALVTNVGLSDSSIPTDIYAIKAGSASKVFDLGGNAGIFFTGLRRNTIVVRDSSGVDESAIIMHEYVHFLIRNFGSLNYPMWFHEGFAEYLSSMRIRSETVAVGGVPPHRVRSFTQSSWIPLQSIIARRGDDDWPPRRNSMFYAEAWSLVHFLQNRPEQEESFDQQLKSYAKLLDSGAEPIESFEEAFGITMQRLDRDVRDYLGGNRVPGFSLETDELIADFEPEVTRMSREQISLALGQYALVRGNLDEAENWFTIASGDERFRARAEAGLGDVQKFQGNFDEALPHFELAIDLAPSDPYCQLDMAEYWHDLARQADEKEDVARYLARARGYYVTAWNINPNMPELYAMVGETYIMEGEDYDRAIEMLEQAQRLLPANTQIQFLLAEAYLGAERTDDAARAARSVMAWSHGDSEAAERALEILAETEGEE